VQLSPLGVRDASEIERRITAFARGANGGLILASNPTAVAHRDLIITLSGGPGTEMTRLSWHREHTT
jgi:hypothetical protein